MSYMRYLAKPIEIINPRRIRRRVTVVVLCVCVCVCYRATARAATYLVYTLKAGYH